MSLRMRCVVGYKGRTAPGSCDKGTYFRFPVLLGKAKPRMDLIILPLSRYKPKNHARNKCFPTHVPYALHICKHLFLCLGIPLYYRVGRSKEMQALFVLKSGGMTAAQADLPQLALNSLAKDQKQ